jgi:hypothetical protein
VTDPTTLTVVSYGGQESTPDSSGNFTAAVTPLGNSLVAAMVTGKNFGWMAFSTDQSTQSGQTAVQAARQTLASRKMITRSRPVFVTKYQITSSAQAASNSGSITTDATTTAESLLFLTPYFYTSNPTLGATIQMTIAQDPTIPALAQALESAQTESDPINDPSVQSALKASVKSVYAALTSGSPVTTSGSTRSMGRSAHEMSTRAIAQDSPASLFEEATPYCRYGFSQIAADPSNLKCLDLDFIRVSAQTASGASFNTAISNNNCAHDNAYSPTDYVGCGVDWLVMVGPKDGSWSPSGGVDSIAPGQENLGSVYSPLNDFDPQCTESTPSGNPHC